MSQSTPLLQFLKWEKEVPNDLFLRQPFQGEWRNWTFQQAGEEARKIAAGLPFSANFISLSISFKKNFLVEKGEITRFFRTG